MSAEKIIQIAMAEVGYQEKASNDQLDSKTANAGKNNYTKYGAWYGMNGQPWCDMFVSWCAAKAGEADAVGKYAYVPSHVQFFKGKGQYFDRGDRTPQAGDIIFFRNESHVGIVEYATSGYVHTIEGNTSGTAGLVSDGGQVARKSYALTSTYIMGYGRPAYSAGTSANTTATKEEFEVAKTYQNGSTEEPVYADTGKKTRIGSLNPWEACDCLGKAGNMYIVRYKVDGTSDYKVGLVVYSGGLA